MVQRIIVLISLSACLISGCDSRDTYPTVETVSTSPPVHIITTPLPRTLPELIKLLSAYDAESRIAASRSLGAMGASAADAVPSLVSNLSYSDTSEVRKEAAIALGEIGSAAKAAVPGLILTLRDEAPQVRRSAAAALGKIDNTSAVPSLAEALYNVDKGTSISAAVAIAQLAKLDLPDRNSINFQMGEDGIPIIVTSVRKWWESEGKNKKWI